MSTGSLGKIKTWSSMIKIEHTLFSLPFVLSAAVLALDSLEPYKSIIDTNYDYLNFLWIFLCLLGARSAGMTLNRIIDAKIDAKNPRTANREIPQGKISLLQAWFFTVVSIAVLVFAAFQLPKLCQLLLPIPIIWVWTYPYLKRFTWFCHFFLGTTLAGATLGGWIAITGSVDTLAPIYLSLAVMTWVSGFDIIYACQDYEHDKAHDIKSVPARFGLKGATQLSKFLHFLTPLFLYFAGEELALGLIYKVGIFFVIAALLYEQKLVKAAIEQNDMNKIDKAFFQVNSWISVLIFTFVILDVFL